MRKPAIQPATPQSGFSLITTLILLIVVTVLGLAASRIVLMSEKTSRFDRDTQIAFQAAEAALLDAEIDIQGTKDAAGNYVISGLRMGQFDSKTASTFVSDCAGTGAQRGMCKPTTGAKPIWYQVEFTDDSANAKTVKFGEFTGREFVTGSKGIRPEMAPRYIIDYIEDIASPGKLLYRITAMGFGPRKETQVVLQVVFRKI
ncbi:MAG: PilX N-terminal domain-containing pilus assembly protein [Burkholderiaceae bacterium]